MANKKSPGGILVRPIQFEYPEDLEAHWHPKRPEWSHVVNAASLLMPYLEPFLIEAIREAVPKIDDPTLRAEAKGYVGQEAHHFKQHRKFNELLIARGYERLREYEKTLERDYDRLRTKSLRFRLAYAAGFETMALMIGHMLIDLREELFRDADPAVSSLVLWHFVEEIEHKNAAFDVYENVVGSWPLRVWGFVYAAFHTMGRTRQAYRELLRIDGRWGRLETRWELKKLLGRIFGYLSRWVWMSVRPSHHPSEVADPEWAREWVELYDREEDRLRRLDTARIELRPAEMMR